jgi:hypothetical protein
MTADKMTKKLQDQTAAVRLSHEQLGTRRKLTRDQMKQAAGLFDADEHLMQAAKRLFDLSHPTFKAISSARSRATQYWRLSTTPFPERGVRLINRDRIPAFEARMEEFRKELGKATAKLQAEYEKHVQCAREKLGDLFDPSDYPATVDGEFSIDWDYPNFEPPDYLKEVSPTLWKEQRDRMEAKFTEAITLAEQAFVKELGKLLAHLVERLAGDEDGKPKVFKGSTVKNLGDFFERFKSQSIGSNSELDKLVKKSRKVLSGVDPDELRADMNLRTEIAAKLTEVAKIADQLMVDRPKRKITFTDDEE